LELWRLSLHGDRPCNASHCSPPFASAPSPPKHLSGGEFEGAKNKLFRIERFHDPNSGVVLYISETGSIAVIGGHPQPPAQRADDSTHRLTLDCPKGIMEGEKPALVRFNVEGYRDRGSSAWLYVTETGAVAAAPIDAKHVEPNDAVAEECAARPCGCAAPASSISRCCATAWQVTATERRGGCWSSPTRGR
jgi:hypothetical protein